MPPFTSSSASGRYRRVLGSRHRPACRPGYSIRWRSMATVTNGPPTQPDSTTDLDSHLLSALRWSGQKGTTLGGLSREFNANAGRVLGISLPYESTPPLSRRLTFHESGSSKRHQGIVMVAHCISSKDDVNPQKSKVKLSSGFVIGDGLIVTCAHTFEEVSSSSDKPE